MALERFLVDSLSICSPLPSLSLFMNHNFVLTTYTNWKLIIFSNWFAEQKPFQYLYLSHAYIISHFYRSQNSHQTAIKSMKLRILLFTTETNSNLYVPQTHNFELELNRDERPQSRISTVPYCSADLIWRARFKSNGIGKFHFCDISPALSLSILIWAKNDLKVKNGDLNLKLAGDDVENWTFLFVKFKTTKNRTQRALKSLASILVNSLARIRWNSLRLVLDPISQGFLIHNVPST